MGNSKDGKLGIQLDIDSVVDVELPMKLKPLQRIHFFQHKEVQTITKQYALFEDYDEIGKLVPILKKNIAYEITQICCGNNF